MLEGQNDGCFHDIGKITMFADYRIPQALVHFGAMRYSEDLLKKLKEGLYLVCVYTAVSSKKACLLKENRNLVSCMLL